MQIAQIYYFEVIYIKALISEYQSITSEITRLKERVSHIYYAATVPKPKIITDMPMAPGFSGGGLENVFIQIEALDERIKALDLKLELVSSRIETKLDLAGLHSTDRVVFWYREVQDKTWREIAAVTGKSVRQLQRISKKTIYTSLLL